MRTTSPAIERAVAEMVFRRLQGIKTVHVYGQETTIDAQGIARDKYGDTVWEFEPGEVDGKSKEEIKSKLETIFFYDRPENT